MKLETDLNVLISSTYFYFSLYILLEVVNQYSCYKLIFCKFFVFSVYSSLCVPLVCVCVFVCVRMSVWDAYIVSASNHISTTSTTLLMKDFPIRQKHVRGHYVKPRM